MIGKETSNCHLYCYNKWFTYLLLAFRCPLSIMLGSPSKVELYIRLGLKWAYNRFLAFFKASFTELLLKLLSLSLFLVCGPSTSKNLSLNLFICLPFWWLMSCNVTVFGAITEACLLDFGVQDKIHFGLRV